MSWLTILTSNSAGQPCNTKTSRSTPPGGSKMRVLNQCGPQRRSHSVGPEPEGRGGYPCLGMYRPGVGYGCVRARPGSGVSPSAREQDRGRPPCYTLIEGTAMAGKYFEEFTVGQVFKHQPGRTITETDNVLFTTLTMNPQPLHLDEEFAKQTEFGQRLVNSLLTLGIAVGLSVADTTLGTTIANLGFDKVEFPKPVFHGDTIYVETEIIDKRESRSRPDAGVVFFEHRAINQRQELVARVRRAGLMRKKPV